MTISPPQPSDHATDEIRDAVLASRAAWEDSIIALSADIHRNPELAFAEHHAAARVADTLRAAGFTATVGAFGLDTAVDATYGEGDITVAICAEYDALPGIGHACGHNVIAAAGAGAAIALASVADAIGLRVKLLGTPAEEHGGGKILMLEAGAWDDVDFSLMVHGGPGHDLRCADVRTQAVARFDVSFQGRPGHAGAPSPDGVNAANAATIGLVALGLLRQHLPDGTRANAFVSEGGEATNIIPSATRVRVEVRADTLEAVETARRRILACFEGGAVATGCEWSWEDAEPTYADVVQNPVLAGAWDRNLAVIGRSPQPYAGAPRGSTDMGNVSHAVPAIHPIIAIEGCASAPHTPAFTSDAIGPAADRAGIDGALAMALTVVDAVAHVRARRTLGAEGTTVGGQRYHGR
ncbi:amidohydrolase [Micromonospora olivasterospora]|uniref:Peptidase M20 domain-containing protein 2 n=1 Tax=Micromonospora olivasterospora TaxID=1880 RepID=A0A562IBD1_MICOL|nr:amidohydrolase [Micromonospora olivasterospora]TWH68166.1 amidohydrolase [Micromonospora olivasterospora]